MDILVSIRILTTVLISAKTMSYRHGQNVARGPVAMYASMRPIRKRCAAWSDGLIRRWWRGRIRRSALRRWPYVSKPRRPRCRPPFPCWSAALRLPGGLPSRLPAAATGTVGTTALWAPTTRLRWRRLLPAPRCTPGACTTGACNSRTTRRSPTDSAPLRRTTAIRWYTRPAPDTGCDSKARPPVSCNMRSDHIR